MHKLEIFKCQFSRATQRVLCGLVLFAFASLGYAEIAASETLEIRREKAFDSINLERYLQLLIDPDQEMIESDILDVGNQELFAPLLGNDVFLISRGNFWLRLTLNNLDSQELELRLVHAYSYTDYLVLYRQDSDHLERIGRRGDLSPSEPEANNYCKPAFHLKLKPGLHTFYLRINTLGPVNLKFSLWKVAPFLDHGFHEYILLGVLFGFVSVMIGYNIFLAIRLRNPSYYFYVGYIACFGIVQLVFSGTAQHLLPESDFSRFFVNQGLVLAAEMTATCGSLFALAFLKVRSNSPLIYKLMLGFYPFSFMNAVTVFIDYNLSVSLVLLTNCYISALLMSAGIQGCIRGYRPAYFYVAAWGFLIIGSLITMARIYGFLPDTPFTAWSQFVGGAIEVVLLSLALGDKISLEQEESHSKISSLNSDLNTANSQLKDHIDNVEAIVEEKTRDIKSILHNIHQGIFMLSSKDSRVMSDYSSHLSSILDSKDIAGKTIGELLLQRSHLSSDQLNQTETVIMSALGDSELNFEVNQNLLAKEMIISDSHDHEKIIELEWNPIADNQGLVDKILVTLRDVTILRQLQVKQADQQHELEAIGKVLAIPADKFNSFLTTCDDFLQSCQAVLESTNVLNLKAIHKIFMNIHTLKGIARSFHLDDLASEFHHFETKLEPYRKDSKAHLDSSSLIDHLQIANHRVQFYRTMNCETLGRKSTDPGEKSQPSWIRAKLKLLQNLDLSRMKSDERDLIFEIIDSMERHFAKSLENSVSGLLSSIPSLAKRLGKSPPDIIFDHADILLTAEGQTVADRIFVHLFNNSIDHGIESDEDRKFIGKPKRGEIRISASIENDQLVICYGDDGHGLDLLKIYNTGLSLRLISAEYPSRTELANLIFEPGFTTKNEASETSGRGVGLDAVRTYLHNDNSSIEIQLLNDSKRLDDLDAAVFQFIIRLDSSLFLVPKSGFRTKVAS